MQHGSTYTCCLLATRLSLVAKAALKLPGSGEDHGAPWTWNSPQTSSPSSSLQEKGEKVSHRSVLMLFTQIKTLKIKVW